MVTDMDFTNEGNIANIVKREISNISSKYNGIYDYHVNSNDDTINVWTDDNGVIREIVKLEITLYTYKEFK